MKKNTKFLTVIFSVIMLGYAVVINVLSSGFFTRLDLTQNGIYSISKVSRDVLKNLDDLVTLELYFSDNLPQNLKKVQKDIKDIADEFKIYGGRNIRVVWKDPVKRQGDKDDALALNIPAIRVQTIEKDKVQFVDGYMGIAVRYGGKSESIPLVQATDNFEYEIIRRVIRMSAKSLPMVGIVKTDTAAYIDPRLADFYAVEIPQDITHTRFAPIFQALIPDYNLQYINFGRDSVIDPAISTIIIPGEDEGSYFTNPDAIFAIDQYLMRGGNVIVLAQKFAINLQKSATASISDSFLYKMLKAWGVVVLPQMLIDASCGQIMVPRQAGATVMNVPTNYPFMVRVSQDGFNRNISPLSSMTQVIFPWASPLEVSADLDGATIADTLIMSSQYSTVRNPPFRIDPNQNWDFHFENAQNSGTLKRYPLAIRLSGKINSIFNDTTLQRPQGREVILSTTSGSVIVVGNADFATTDAGGGGVNMPLVQNLTDWLSLDDNLIGIRSRNMADRTLKNITMKTNADNSGLGYKILNAALMPVVLIIIGLFIFFYRKRQQYNGGK